MTLQVLNEEQLLYLVEIQLPDLLERHPEWEARIYGVLLRMFARREEVAAIMTELRELRTEMNARFDEIVGQADVRFEQVDARFDEIVSQADVRFGQVDARFAQVDARFAQVDARFEQVDARFEQVDARFEQIDAHLERIDTHFEQIDTHFEHIERRLDKMDNDLSGFRDWMYLNVGQLQTRTGRELEDVIAGALRFALKRPDIRPENILLRQPLFDKDGLVYPRGRTKEVDIVASDGEYLLFEVKSAAKPGEVDDFADKVTLARLLYPDKDVKGIFISLAARYDVQERCRQLGIELLK